MRCPRCSAENPEGIKFCEQCGSPLRRRCAQCGFENSPAAKFCGECGTPLATPPADAPAKKFPDVPVRLTAVGAPENLEGERKTVTALFADIKGSTELEQDLDPEEARAIVDPALKLMIDSVQRYDGHVVQSTGDGIFAIFGAPVAREDHPQRALYAALSMQDEIRRYADKLRAEGHSPLQIRIGADTGEVVLRTIEIGGRKEYTPIGNAPNLASRMQSLADPGSTVISESTRNLVEGFFTLKPLGASRVKGIAEPINVYEVSGVGQLRTRLDVARSRGFSKFVGRDREMTVLEGALQAATAGHGQVVGVVAEAGTGKSRLCFEFVEKCRARGVRVNQGHCPAHGKTVPFLPLLEVLRDIFGIAERDSDHEARRKIAGELLLLDDAFQQMLPILFDFMGVSDPARPSPAMSPEGRQQMLFAFVRHLTEARSKREPTVIFLDDLHWIDPGSDAFLTHAVGAVQNTRTLYLVNFRPEYRADWMRKPYYQQVALAPLGAEATREMLADLMGAGPSVSAISERIHHRTAGNPFFIEEVVQSMVESGRLSGTRGHYQLTGPVDAVEIPSTVQTVLAARIDRLGADEKRRLQTASVIGKEFTAAILGAVVAADEDRTPAAKPLESSLDTLRDAEFIYETALYPEVEYAFKHPLTQEVAYQSQLSGRRAHLHAAVARTIERRDADKLDERAALIAYHWEQAGEPLIAAKWYARAAEEAGVDSPADAMRHWEKVRELLVPLPHSDESDALRLRATSESMVFGFRQGLSNEKLEELHAEGKALALALGDIRGHLRILYGVITHRVNLGKIRQAISVGEEALALANSTGDPELVWAAREPLAWAHIAHGDLLTALAMTEQQIELGLHNPTIGKDIISFGASNSFTHYGLILNEIGRFDEAVEAFRRGQEMARAHHENEVLAWQSAQLSRLLERRGDVQASLAAGRRGIEAADEIGSQFARVMAWGSFGSPTLFAGHFEACRNALELALDIAREHRVALAFEAEYQAVLAEAYLGSGDATRARQLAEEAIRTAKLMESRVCEVRSRLAHARILLGLEGAAARNEIESELDCAADLVRATGAISYEPQIVVEGARLAKSVGDLERSSALKNEAHRMFIAMGAHGRAERLTKELP